MNLTKYLNSRFFQQSSQLNWFSALDEIHISILVWAFPELLLAEIFPKSGILFSNSTSFRYISVQPTLDSKEKLKVKLKKVRKTTSAANVAQENIAKLEQDPNMLSVPPRSGMERLLRFSKEVFR